MEVTEPAILSLIENQGRQKHTHKGGRGVFCISVCIQWVWISRSNLGHWEGRRRPRAEWIMKYPSLHIWSWFGKHIRHLFLVARFDLVVFVCGVERRDGDITVCLSVGACCVLAKSGACFLSSWLRSYSFLLVFPFFFLIYIFSCFAL